MHEIDTIVNDLCSKSGLAHTINMVIHNLSYINSLSVYTVSYKFPLKWNNVLIWNSDDKH